MGDNLEEYPFSITTDRIFLINFCLSGSKGELQVGVPYSKTNFVLIYGSLFFCLTCRSETYVLLSGVVSICRDLNI